MYYSRLFTSLSQPPAAQATSREPASPETAPLEGVPPQVERPNQDPTAFPLPPELVLMVCRYLPKVSNICLALTCRGLYSGHFLESADLHPDEKREFLLLVERDVPGRYFCHHCVKLHSWHGAWCIIKSKASNPEVCMSLHRLFRVGTSYCLPYPFARLVMNRHLYGPSHGLPLRNIGYDGFRYLSSGCTIAFRESWQAKTIAGELFIRTTYEISDQPAGDSKRLQQFIDDYYLDICHHLHLDTQSHCSYSSRIMEVEYRYKGNFVECVGAVRRCSSCQTDCEVDITCSRGAWKVRLVVYRLLGDCRDPSGRAWLEITSARKGQRAHPLSGIPSVRDRWLRDEETVKP